MKAKKDKKVYFMFGGKTYRTDLSLTLVECLDDYTKRYYPDYSQEVRDWANDVVVRKVARLSIT